MTKTQTSTASLPTMFGFLLVGMLFLGLVPQSTSAASQNAFLGGGNALSRALSGQSQGLAHATSTSDLLAHLTFASTRGGRPEETPPADQNSNTGGNTSDQSNGPSGQNGDPAGGAGGDNANGGAAAGNGGDGGSGGNASSGGLVRAGSVVSNATAFNTINLNIVRISSH